MRALGFGAGTVVFMLAGELGVAVLLALPLGAVIGPGLGQLRRAIFRPRLPRVGCAISMSRRP